MLLFDLFIEVYLVIERQSETQGIVGSEAFRDQFSMLSILNIRQLKGLILYIISSNNNNNIECYLSKSAI